MNEKAGQTYEPRICPSCAASFGCGAKAEGCWCSEVKISTASTADLKAKFSDCLCPKCLAIYALDSAMAVTYPNGRIEIIVGAMRVDTQNFHEGMYDFYDERGNLLAQIEMGSGVSWACVGPPE